MRKLPLLVYALLFMILAGCSSLSKDEAEKIIVEEYSNHLSEATIISTIEKENEYYIEWDNKENKYRGTSKVSADGKVTMIEAEIE